MLEQNLRARTPPTVAACEYSSRAPHRPTAKILHLIAMIHSTSNSSGSRKLMLVSGSVRQALTKDDLRNHPDSMLATLYARYDTGCNSQTTLKDSSSASAAAEWTCGGSSSSSACSRADLGTPDNTCNSVTPVSRDFCTGTHPDRASIDVELAGSCVIATMKATPHNPCSYWSDTPVIIAGLYRDGCIAGNRLAQMLQEASKSKPLLYLWLSQLLSFLALPGPVINWLPPISNLDIRCAGAISFIEYCWVRWQAQLAADLMLAYKPYESKLGEGQHCSFFMVVDVANGRCNYTADDSSLPACLAVYALNVPSDTVAAYKAMAPGITLTHGNNPSPIRPPTEPNVSAGAAFGYLEYENMMLEHVTLLTSNGHPSTKAPTPGTTVKEYREKHLVGGDHPDFGEHLLSMLQSEVQGFCKVVAGTAQATYSKYANDRYGFQYTIPLWAVFW